MFDLDVYLERIGLQGRPDPREVHRAHSVSIPFENLDSYTGKPVSLTPEDLERKLVRECRGGYCFEQNLLLKAAMEALGAEVDLFLARVRRVRAGAAPGAVRPRSHLVLRVRYGDESWHADVGFGLGTLLEPIPWGPGEQFEQAGWRFRVVQDGPELVLQEGDGDGWIDLYGFPPQPVPLIDVETVNWWTSTHPHSPFVTGLIAARHDSAGTRTALSDWDGLALSVRTPNSEMVSEVTREDVPELLATHFDLRGFELGDDERIRPRRPRPNDDRVTA